MILAVEPGLLDVLGVEIMNRLAEDGYESLAAGCDTGRLDGLLDRAGSRGWTPEQVASWAWAAAVSLFSRPQLAWNSVQL